MKKQFLFWLAISMIVLIFANLYAGHRKILLRNGFTNARTLGSRTWSIQGTSDPDTSEMIYTGPTMSLSWWASDSLSADSVALRLIYEVLGANNKWDSVKTTTITTDTVGYWNITDEAIPVNKIARIRVYGESGTRINGPVLLKLEFNIYE